MTTATRQRADLTYKANKNAGRHGWLRLTPAYSLKLVRNNLSALPEGSSVLDPFSGSGTTALVSQEMGLSCEAREINPFLVWFGNAKLDEYSPSNASSATETAKDILDDSERGWKGEFWEPPIYRIDKWWNGPTRKALSYIKSRVNETTGKTRNLLDIAFCRTMIATSSASFNHQSMSFKEVSGFEDGEELNVFHDVLAAFLSEVKYVSETSQNEMRKTSKIVLGDSTTRFDGFKMTDLVITSPPYANRMSYIRELRPYMYWLGYLDSGSQAGELDWRTTGGTWGSASTKLKYWEPDEETPVDSDLDNVCRKILDGKSGEVLSPYVKKYFHDMWSHFQSITPMVKPGGKVCYIVGNSTFSGIEVPSHLWYEGMLRELGFADVHSDVIRKRNSNKKLFEYAVWGSRQ